LTNTAGVDSSAVTIWDAVRLRLARDIGSADFRAWIEPLTLECTDELVVLKARNEFARDQVRTHHLHRVRTHWVALDPLRRAIRVDLANAEPTPKATVAKSAQQNGIVPFPAERVVVERTINPRQTFSSFVAGASNEVALAVAQNIASGEGIGLDVVLFHGPHGVGKTHLLQAIAANAELLTPERRVLYLTAEQFLAEFVAAVRGGGGQAFKEMVRGADLLLIDDLQFIAGKLQTQDEFFHTLESLIQSGKHVVCSGDTTPDGMDRLDARLKSRLSGGIVCRLSEPDLDTRRAIVRAKAALYSEQYPTFILGEDAVELIASRLVTTGRILDGAVKKVLAASAMVKREPTLELVRLAIADLCQPTEKRVTVEIIQKRVAAFYDLSVADLVSANRARAVVRPRQIAMYFCKKLTARSLPDIGRRFGGRDHTTVLHAVRKIEDLIAKEPHLAGELTDVQRRVQE
jgi:chromosomal replication initiator protein